MALILWEAERFIRLEVMRDHVGRDRPSMFSVRGDLQDTSKIARDEIATNSLYSRHKLNSKRSLAAILVG